MPSLHDPLPNDIGGQEDDGASQDFEAPERPPCKSRRRVEVKVHKNPLTAAIVYKAGITIKSIGQLRAESLSHLSKDGDDFMEIFSPPRMTPMFALRGKRGQIAIDVLCGWDLSDPAVKNFVFELIGKRNPKAAMLSPPCTAYSRLQDLSKDKRDEGLFHLKMKESQGLLKLSMQIAEVQIKKGNYFIFEHPASAVSWQQSCVSKIASRKMVSCVVFDQCRFGLQSKVHQIPHKKSTKFMTNCKEVADAFRDVKCKGDHKHQEIMGTEGGQSRSSWAAIYPDNMCNALVDAVCVALDSK